MTNKEFIQRLKKARKWIVSKRHTDNWLLWKAMRAPGVRLAGNYEFGANNKFENQSVMWLSLNATLHRERKAAALAVIDNSIAALQQTTEPNK